MNVYKHLELSHQTEAIAALPSPPEMGDSRSDIHMDATVELVLWLAPTPDFGVHCLRQHDTGATGITKRELEEAGSNSKAETP